MKKSLVAIIILLLIGIAIAVILKFPQNNSITSQEQETQLSWDIDTIPSWDHQIITWDTATGNEHPLVYTNTEFGFQFILPEGWENYEEFIYRYSGDNTIASIVIALPTNESNRPGILDPNDSNLLVLWYTGQYKYITWYANMIWFSVYTHSWYDTIINTPDAIWSKDVRIDETIGSWLQYVYILNGPQDFPPDIYSIWWRKYFKPILDSFKAL